MDDGSTSLFSQETLPGAQLTEANVAAPELLFQEGNMPIAARPLVILYSHSLSLDTNAQDLVARNEENEIVLCESFDTLLSILEEDIADVIVFDESVSDQETSYIKGWARIFKPSLVFKQLGLSSATKDMRVA